jgi:hypothetical protein
MPHMSPITGVGVQRKLTYSPDDKVCPTLATVWLVGSHEHQRVDAMSLVAYRTWEV